MTKYYMINIPLIVDKKAGKIEYDYPKWMNSIMKKKLINMSCTELGDVSLAVFYISENDKEDFSKYSEVVEKDEEFYNSWLLVRQAELDLKVKSMEVKE